MSQAFAIGPTPGHVVCLFGGSLTQNRVHEGTGQPREKPRLPAPEPTRFAGSGVCVRCHDVVAIDLAPSNRAGRKLPTGWEM